MNKSITDAEQKRIFANNLRDAINRSGKQQIDVARAIGVSQQTFNSWCRGIALPRIGKIEKLSQYFGIKKSDLLDNQAPEPIVSNSLRKYAEKPLTQDDEAIKYTADEIEKALDIYEKYKKAIPQVQSAIEALLKGSQSET